MIFFNENLNLNLNLKRFEKEMKKEDDNLLI